MKKISALLICSVLLLGGCNGDTISESAPPETEESVQTTASTTAENTAPAIVDDISEENENALPEGYDYIVPTKGELKIAVSIDKSTRLDTKALADEVGYELPGVDLESDEYYVRHRERIEADYTGEELEEWRRMNYFYEVTPRAYYCGSEQEDWIAIIEYNYGSQISPYSRLAHIKDGEIVHLSEIIDASCAWQFSDGQLITPAGDKGLCIYDIASREISYISKADNGMELDVRWSDMYLVDDRYILFEHIRSKDDNGMYMYDRENGSVTELDGLYLDPMMHRYALHGDKLHCYNTENGEYTIYDLSTGEITNPETYDITKIIRFETDDFVVTSADKSNPNGITAEAVVVTRKSDGKEKAFDLREFMGEDNYLHDFYAEGNLMYFITYDGIFAVNFNSAEAAEVTGGEDSDCVFYCENSHVMVRGDGYTALVKIISPESDMTIK